MFDSSRQSIDPERYGLWNFGMNKSDRSEADEHFPVTAAFLIGVCVVTALGWFLTLAVTGWNYHEIIMFFSNLAFLLPSVLHAYLGMYFESLLWLLVFFSSNNYHICYGELRDYSLEPRYGLLCGAVPSTSVYGILLADLIIANMANVNSFLKLMPVPQVVERNTGYITKLRQFLTIMTALVVFLATLFDGSTMVASVDVDNSYSILIGVTLYMVFLFVLHVIFFFARRRRVEWEEVRAYYVRNFYVRRVVLSIGILVAAACVWQFVPDLSLATEVPYLTYFYMAHPAWHLIGMVAIVVYVSSYRYTESRDESFFDRLYEEARREDPV